MAEAVGLAASIIQIAGVGVKLSTTLYNFIGSAVRADSELGDIAGDVEITANALDSVGKVFEDEDSNSIVSRKAIQDAGNLIKRCESVFTDIESLTEKRKKVGKEGKKVLSTFGRLGFPLKEQRIQLLRTRLESLKNSLVLLLNVLQLANAQAKGKLEKSRLEEERERIRLLHQREQESMKTLAALEACLHGVSLNDDDDATLQGSALSSRSSTLKSKKPSDGVTMQSMPATDAQASAEISEEDWDVPLSSDTDDDEHVTLEEINKCANHVNKLLRRISALQESFQTSDHAHGRLPRKRIRRLYRRFCYTVETEIRLNVNSTEGSGADPRPSTVSQEFLATRKRTNETNRGRVGTAMESITSRLSIATHRRFGSTELDPIARSFPTIPGEPLLNPHLARIHEAYDPSQSTTPQSDNQEGVSFMADKDDEYEKVESGAACRISKKRKAGEVDEALDEKDLDLIGDTWEGSEELLEELRLSDRTLCREMRNVARQRQASQRARSVLKTAAEKLDTDGQMEHFQSQRQPERKKWEVVGAPSPQQQTSQQQQQRLRLYQEQLRRQKEHQQKAQGPPSPRLRSSPVLPVATIRGASTNTEMRKRTKTGCLTCRKHRIKCGEERPICNNCVRSERQCEGYNQRVIFKTPVGDWHPGVMDTAQNHSSSLPSGRGVYGIPQPRRVNMPQPVPSSDPTPGLLALPTMQQIERDLMMQHIEAQRGARANASQALFDAHGQVGYQGHAQAQAQLNAQLPVPRERPTGLPVWSQERAQPSPQMQNQAQHSSASGGQQQYRQQQQQQATQETNAANSSQPISVEEIMRQFPQPRTISEEQLRETQQRAGTAVPPSVPPIEVSEVGPLDERSNKRKAEEALSELQDPLRPSKYMAGSPSPYLTGDSPASLAAIDLEELEGSWSPLAPPGIDPEEQETSWSFTEGEMQFQIPTQPPLSAFAPGPSQPVLPLYSPCSPWYRPMPAEHDPGSGPEYDPISSAYSPAHSPDHSPAYSPTSNPAYSCPHPPSATPPGHPIANSPVPGDEMVPDACGEETSTVEDNTPDFKPEPAPSDEPITRSKKRSKPAATDSEALDAEPGTEKVVARRKPFPTARITASFGKGAEGRRSTRRDPVRAEHINDEKAAEGSTQNTGSRTLKLEEVVEADDDWDEDATTGAEQDARGQDKGSEMDIVDQLLADWTTVAVPTL